MFFSCNVAFSSLPPFLPTTIHEYEIFPESNLLCYVLTAHQNELLLTCVTGSLSTAMPCSFPSRSTYRLGF